MLAQILHQVYGGGILAVIMHHTPCIAAVLMPSMFSALSLLTAVLAANNKLRHSNLYASKQLRTGAYLQTASKGELVLETSGQSLHPFSTSATFYGAGRAVASNLGVVRPYCMVQPWLRAYTQPFHQDTLVCLLVLY